MYLNLRLFKEKDEAKPVRFNKAFDEEEQKIQRSKSGSTQSVMAKRKIFFVIPLTNGKGKCYNKGRPKRY